MLESTDSTLLESYARQGDAAAFDAFMRRHLDLVYSAALRQAAGDSHRAQDVTQKVFLTAARRAQPLAGHALITGWLHRTTRHIAAEQRRAETRRRKHESAQAIEVAALASDPLPEPSVCWESLGPLLDAALDSLGDKDRETILLRYFAQKPFADIGASLGLTEAAAQMRATRALEKLRLTLAKRGVTSTASALGLALGANAITAAPASVAASTLASLGTASAAAVTSATSAATIFTLMTTSTKLTLGVTAILAAGLAWNARSWLDARDPITPSVSSSSSHTESPQFLPSRPQPQPAVANDASLQVVADLRRQLASLDAELKLERDRADAATRMIDAMFEEVEQRAREAGNNTASVFQSVREAGLFIAAINHRVLALRVNYSSAPAPDDPSYDEYNRRFNAILKDTATFMQDPLITGELTSGDPIRMGQAQASYVTPSIGLSEPDANRVTRILEAAYTEGFTQKLSTDDEPDSPDAVAEWNAARARLNARTVDSIKAILSPAQRELFSRLGYDDLMFKLSIGTEPPSSASTRP